MSTTKLLETLLDIERRLGRAETSTLRNLIMEAQTQVMHIQRDSIQLLEEVQQLRERHETQRLAGPWHAMAQALALSETEKEATRPTALVAVKNRAS